MLSNGFCHAIENPLQIENLTGVLYLYDNDFSFTVACLDVHTIELVVGFLLVAFAFQNIYNLYLLTEKDGEKSLEHSEICLLTQ